MNLFRYRHFPIIFFWLRSRAALNDITRRLKGNVTANTRLTGCRLNPQPLTSPLIIKFSGGKYSCLRPMQISAGLPIFAG